MLQFLTVGVCNETTRFTLNSVGDITAQEMVDGGREEQVRATRNGFIIFNFKQFWNLFFFCFLLEIFKQIIGLIFT